MVRSYATIFVTIIFMTGKTHRLIGLIAGGGYFLATVKPEYQPATLFAVIFMSYIGSLIPDADNAGADIWHTIPAGHTVGKLTDPILKHRNISHSLIGLIVYAGMLYLLLQSMPKYWNISIYPVLISSSIAYASHLFADAFTVQGIPIFWPWRRNFGIPPRPFQGVRIETGQWFENLLLFPLLNIILLVVIWSNWENIRLLIFK